MLLSWCMRRPRAPARVWRHPAAGRSHGTAAGQRDAFADLTTA